MEFKNFKLKIEDLKIDKQSLIAQNFEQLKQLDQLLEQLSSQDKSINIEWELYYDENMFELGWSGDYAYSLLVSKSLENLLNPDFIKTMLTNNQILAKQAKIENEDWLWCIELDLDQKETLIRHKGYMHDFRDMLYIFKHKQHSIKSTPDLLKNCINFTTNFNQQIDRRLTIDKSLELQLLKLIINQADPQKDLIPQSLIDWCKSQLNNPSITSFDFIDNLYEATDYLDGDACLNLCDIVIQELEWSFEINSQKSLILIDLEMYSDANNDSFYIPKIQVSFDQFLKLANDDKFKPILQTWKDLFFKTNSPKPSKALLNQLLK